MNLNQSKLYLKATEKDEEAINPESVEHSVLHMPSLKFVLEGMFLKILWYIYADNLIF